MKKLIRPATIIGLSLILVLISASLTRSAQTLSLSSLSSAALFLQTTPTPQVVDKSEVGSTDQIVIMGGVIALIIFAPIFISRKNWQNSQQSVK